MVILGVADGPDASAALVVEGRPVSVVAQASVDRIRRSRAFPSGAIDAALDVAGLRARDVDRVAIGTSFTPSALLRSRPELIEKASPWLKEAWRGYSSAMRRSGLYMLEQDASRAFFERKLRELGFERARVELVEHDDAHASYAWRTQGEPRVLVVTLDTPGDGAACTVSLGRPLQLDRLHTQTALASICNARDRVAQHLGVPASRLGSLAAIEAPPELVADLGRFVRFDPPGFSQDLVFSRELDAVLGGWGAEQLAAAVEEVVAEAAAAYVAWWSDRTRVRTVALAGALAEDPRVAAAVLRKVDRLWVPPAAGDGNLALGAALAVAGAAPRPLADAGLGPQYSDDACYKQLSVASLPRTKVEDPDGEAARRLADGQVVCRYAGALEIGRSAATRAVLFAGDARGAMKRPPGPVACAVLAGEADFADLDRCADAARFGTVALRASPAFAARYPTLVRADGTALPHVVGEGHPLHGVLAAYEARTGKGALGLLTFRLGGQPPVTTPNDAVRAWRESDADALLLGPYLVDRSATAGSAFQKDPNATQSSPAR
ncbi:MAG: carbamoyltransferase C-terminal domain-containing protein [Myxococcota bacterium]